MVFDEAITVREGGGRRAHRDRTRRRKPDIAAVPRAAAGTRLRVPFNRPYVTGDGARLHPAGDRQRGSSPGTARSRAVRAVARGAQLRAAGVLLTHSCTAALEMAALLADVGPGDEVIMPSFTFVSTANAFVLRGATPVFVDIREDTLNLDERLVEAPSPRAPGRSCRCTTPASAARWTRSGAIARAARPAASSRTRRRRSTSTYRGRPLGSVRRARRRSASTRRRTSSAARAARCSSTTRGWSSAPRSCARRAPTGARSSAAQVDKYTWVDVGSSFLLSELAAAFLWAQLEAAERDHAPRGSRSGTRYHAAFAELEAERAACGGRSCPADCDAQRAHVLPAAARRPRADAADRAARASRAITAVFHYVPLHSSPAGRRFGRADGELRGDRSRQRRACCGCRSGSA